MRIMKPWPGNKKFAFSIVDDTDLTTLENGPLVYDFLHHLGLKTTKTVWIFDGEFREDNNRSRGTTCQDRDYLEWVMKLKEQGFEIAFHGASWSRSSREKVVEALDAFKAYFGDYPKLLAQHSDTVLNGSIYWGANRVSGIYRAIYRALLFLKGNSRDLYQGELKESPYFWGDICRERIKYVRNFIYPEINSLKACPYMPYHDPQRPFVNYWFASTEGPDVDSFNRCLSEENQQGLEDERGACIMYTHFGKDFVSDGSLHPDFKRLMTQLARRDGWFVPVSELLDYLLERKGSSTISDTERARLERTWLWHKIRVGTS